jgi:hypothetical protein
MSRHDALSARERVRLALAHQETDRIPIAMVCAGINRPAYEALQLYLRRERDISVEQYLKPLIDIKGVGPQYIGPPLAEGEVDDFYAGMDMTPMGRMIVKLMERWGRKARS